MRWGPPGSTPSPTLLVAFLRPALLSLFCDRENLREGGVPSPERLGRRVFTDYLLLLTLLHHAVFFVLETLSWSHALHTLARIAVSSAVTALFVWIIARIFTVKFPVRV